MSTPITTAFDTYVSRYPLLANLTYKEADSDETYKGLVDLKDSSWSPVPDGVETHAVAGLGPMAERSETGAFEFDTPGPAGTKKSYYSNYAKAVYFTENLIMDAQYGIIEKVVASLGKSYNLARNLQVAALYDDAFTGSLYTGPDGKALCATDHTSYMGGSARANELAVSAALSYTSVQDLVTIMRKQKDERGYANPAVNSNDTIDVIIPADLEFDADTIFDKGSAYNPTNANNDINVLHKYRWNLKVNNHFTSTTNWFLANPNEKGIRLVDKQALTTDSFQDERQKGMQYDVRARWVIHPEMWEKIYGSFG